jgi:hypothetical protein
MVELVKKPNSKRELKRNSQPEWLISHIGMYYVVYKGYFIVIKFITRFQWHQIRKL